MHPAPSIIAFTVASGAGYGLLFLIGLAAPAGLIPATRAFGVAGLGVALGLITFGLLASLPTELRHLLRQARKGRMNVNLDVERLETFGQRVERSANRMAIAAVVAALIIGSSIVMTVPGGPTLLGLPFFGLLGFVGAVFGGLWLLVSIFRSGGGR